MTRRIVIPAVEQEDVEPIVIELPGGAEFTCRAEVSGLALLDVGSVLASAGGDATRAIMALPQILTFFERCMDPEEYARFTDYCNDPDTVVPIGQLAQIMMELFAEYGGRPTKRSSVSASGPGANGAT